MVEGGRLEIVLAVLSCHVGSNPTLSARKLNIDSMSTISCGELSERSMVNGWKPFVVTSHQRVPSQLFDLYFWVSQLSAVLLLKFFPDLQGGFCLAEPPECAAEFQWQFQADVVHRLYSLIQRNDLVITGQCHVRAGYCI